MVSASAPICWLWNLTGLGDDVWEIAPDLLGYGLTGEGGYREGAPQVRAIAYERNLAERTRRAPLPHEQRACAASVGGVGGGGGFFAFFRQIAPPPLTPPHGHPALHAARGPAGRGTHRGAARTSPYAIALAPQDGIIDHVAALVDHLGLRRVAIVGSSFGSNIACHLFWRLRGCVEGPGAGRLRAGPEWAADAAGHV